MPVFKNLSNIKKYGLSGPHWVTLFKDLIETRYKNYIQIYTDGSKSNTRSACAVWSSNFRIKARLPDDFSVLSTELYAILCALKYIEKQRGQYIIFSDSLSSINSLIHTKKVKHCLISSIIKILTSNSSPLVKIEWIPSHMGIPGNEAADLLAKEALNLTVITKAPLPQPDASRMINQNSNREWTQKMTRIDERLFTPQLEIDKIKMLTRSQQVMLSRLRLKTTKFSHNHLISKKPPPACPQCDYLLTIQHVFLDCPLFDNERNALILRCNQFNTQYSYEAIMNNPFSEEVLLFIESINAKFPI